MGEEATITVTDDGLTLPVTEVLTGRGFITGKSGSGKSNTASVVAEELLDQNFPILIVDTDGEYYGLKETYELLHVGAEADCDIQVGVDHAPKIAELALEENVPIILDVSGYLDLDVADELVKEVIKHLFVKEKGIRKPFLLLVEEIHEFIPESGGLDDLGEMIVTVAKRGRKRGLGLCGMSQRPAAVDKDFITQCDWLVWHRLTWENDTRVVQQMLGSEAADTVQDLDDGEALLVTDWDDRVQQVNFRRKRTFDAGATPGLDEFDRPELKTVGGDLVEELEAIGTGKEPSGADTATLEQKIEERESRIAKLEAREAELRTKLESESARADALAGELERYEDEVDVLKEELGRAREKLEAGGDAQAAAEIADPEDLTSDDDSVEQAAAAAVAAKEAGEGAGTALDPTNAGVASDADEGALPEGSNEGSTATTDADLSGSAGERATASGTVSAGMLDAEKSPEDTGAGGNAPPDPLSPTAAADASDASDDTPGRRERQTTVPEYRESNSIRGGKPTPAAAEVPAEEGPVAVLWEIGTLMIYLFYGVVRLFFSLGQAAIAAAAWVAATVRGDDPASVAYETRQSGPPLAVKVGVGIGLTALVAIVAYVFLFPS